MNMNVEMVKNEIMSKDQGYSATVPTHEVNLEPSNSSVADDLTEDPSAAEGSVPPPSTTTPWRTSTPPQVLSLRTFSDTHGTVSRDTSNRLHNLEGNAIETRQNSYHDDEEEIAPVEPLTPQMSSSLRNFTSYHNRLTPKVMGSGALSLTSSTRSVKSNSSSIVGHYFPDSLNMPPSSMMDELQDTPSLRSDLAGWVIDAPKNAAGITVIENENQQRDRVPLIVVEKQQSTSQQSSRVSIRSHSHHHSGASNSLAVNSLGGINSNSLLTLKKTIQDVQIKLERSLKEMQESNTRDLERLITVIQQESNKRISSLENRLHAQLLLQSETMVAMELKLLRLESKVERREAMILSQQQRRRAYSYPLAATAIDEEGDIRSEDTNNHMDDGSLETMEIQVQKNGNISGNSQSLRLNGASGWVDGESESRADARNNTSRGCLTNVSSDIANNHFQSSSTRNPRMQQMNPRNVAIISSGASLTSAFTATSFLDGEGSTQMDTGYDMGVEGEEGMVSVRTGDGDYDDDDDDGEEVVNDTEFNEGSASTPTQGSSRRMTSSIEAFVLNSMPVTPSEQGLSIRATRGDYDGNSSLATSFTNTTFSSTAITATTKGGDSIYVRSLSQQINDGAHEDDAEIENAAVVNAFGKREDLDCMLGLSPPVAESHCHSPITVQSTTNASVEPLSLASASIGTSILSTAAVAPTRSLRTQRDVGPQGSFGDHRPLANPVVSFTSGDVFSVPPEILGTGDSITMPDELDNISDIADVFNDRARHWREDYEKRLEALQKRWGVE